MSTAKKVRAWIRHRPYVLWAIENEIVSLEKLTNLIKSHLKEGSKHAIKVAISRYQKERKKRKTINDRPIFSVLRRSRLRRVYPDVKVIITEEPLRNEDPLIFTELGDNYVYVFEKSVKIPERVLKRSNTQVNKNCAVIEIESSKKVEKTPGVVAYLTSIIAEQDINIVEFISCYKTTILIVRSRDYLRTLTALEPIFQSAEEN